MSFTAPGLLFLEGWNKPQRAWTRDLLAALRQHGYSRTVEPCSGSLAMSLMAHGAGFEPKRMEASDVSLFSALLGVLIDPNRELDELGIRLDGELLEPDGADDVERAADVMVTQLALRHERTGNHHTLEYVRDLTERREHHRAGVAKRCREIAGRLTGTTYWTEDAWDTLARAADDPKAVLLAEPPSYKGGYEKLYNTGGRLTWDAEPQYAIWVPGEDHARLLTAAEDWKALLLCVEPTLKGESTGDPLSAFDMARGRAMYVWSNRPDEVRARIEAPHVGSRGFGDSKKPPYPIIGYDHEVTEDSTFGVAELGSAEARYLRDLWAHRIDPSGGSANIAVIVDGRIAGILGYMTTFQYTGSVSRGVANIAFIQGAMGAPHKQMRFGRLATMLGCNRQTIHLALKSWFATRVDLVQTVCTSKHPEVKVNRGIMKLIQRRIDKQHGYRLNYEAVVREETIEETAAEWLKKELARLPTPASA